MARVEAYFAQLASYDILTGPWRSAIHEVGLAESPRDQVRGPAGAHVAAARRLSWAIPSADVVLPPTGAPLKVKEEPPSHAVHKLALQAFTSWPATRSVAAARLRGIPDLVARNQVVRSSYTYPAAVASLHEMGEGGWPPQDTTRDAQSLRHAADALVTTARSATA